MDRGKIVVGHGRAGTWSRDASEVCHKDGELLARARERGLLRSAHDAGYATRDGKLLEDAWLLVVGDVDESTLDWDPSVIAYCGAMARYYRVQPAGLGISGHYSETSADILADGLHVFLSAYEAAHGDDTAPHRYGDEVVEIEASRDWPNGDVEGVCIDPETATIVRRWPLKTFVQAFDALPLDEYGSPPHEMP